ncbi:MaoC family dehydratase [Rhodococcus triatomae]|uniref:N-terminal half of MaoC dehydratase n=1 Tax=Rhodococcus triatomae TaxID=300028 RepID=A0A1G8QGC0_9NOCA|nr:MaoC family dehydratase N-terminal domain-containing protein [Rhodococcus triatomae]QNG20677.1 MaoC family dehydratase [Rhodococcus triatomae]QNG23405.1 MaoC family dehydratase [Rhodococcus triatomae]SDJ03824.1 N-terminal half of MaoC dehydratase [Rhodococcus triatomae]
MHTLDRQFDQFHGLEAEPPRVSRYPVNEAMIRNWVEAHEDDNPVYVDARAARETGRAQVICPPAMISTWVMAGYRRWREVHRLRAEGRTEDSAYSRLLAMLDESGFTSVVATDVEQDYHRELVPGDHVTARITIESISPVKRTGLGDGRFLTLHKRYENQNGELLVEERFRLLRFDPSTAGEARR